MAELHDGLTERERQVLDFILTYKVDHDGCSPRIRQIGTTIGTNSTSLVQYYLYRLMEKKRIVYTGAEIHVVGGQWLGPVMG